MQKVFKIAFILLIAYSFLLIGFFTAMRQKPEVFSKIISKTPNIAFLILPFKPMWLYARQGNLTVGKEAPDFSLEAFDKKSRVRLSDFRGKKPVVLVFGSYT